MIVIGDSVDGMGRMGSRVSKRSVGIYRSVFHLGFIVPSADHLNSAVPYRP